MPSRQRVLRQPRPSHHPRPHRHRKRPPLGIRSIRQLLRILPPKNPHSQRVLKHQRPLIVKLVRRPPQRHPQRRSRRLRFHHLRLSPHPCFHHLFGQQIEINLVTAVLKKDRLTPVPALSHMVRKPRNPRSAPIEPCGNNSRDRYHIP